MHRDARLLEYVADYFKTQAMWIDEAVCREPYTLQYFPDHFIMQEMCEGVMHVRPAKFFLIPDHFKIQEKCIRGVKVDPWQLKDVPDHFKTRNVQ